MIARSIKITGILLFLSLAYLFALSCNQKEPQNEGNNNPVKEKALIDANRQMVKAEDRQIKDMLERYGWKMTETGSGLRYLIYQEGPGLQPEEGKAVRLAYSVKLLNGDLIYSSEKDGMMEFIVGKGGVPAGLEEGILLLHVGDKAKLIIPSHLAYGLLGDQNKIPPKVTLVYDVHLVELK